MIIDTHCHLDDEKYNEDLEEVLQRAKQEGIKGVILPGADINDLEKAQAIAHKHTNVFFAAGVHPYHIDEYDEQRLRKFLEDKKCIAVGECGLDYFRLPEAENEKEAEVALQKKVFREHIRLAKELQKPLIVHVRDASWDSRVILEEENAQEVGGVLHCYNADEQLLPLAKQGFYFGIGGVLTFKNAKKLVNVLEKIPKEKLLLETDAPYLTPHPHRGKRNEPAYTALVAQKIADLLEMDYESVCELTTKNAKVLFKELCQLD